MKRAGENWCEHAAEDERTRHAALGVRDGSERLRDADRDAGGAGLVVVLDALVEAVGGAHLALVGGLDLLGLDPGLPGIALGLPARAFFAQDAQIPAGTSAAVLAYFQNPLLRMSPQTMTSSGPAATTALRAFSQASL